MRRVLLVLALCLPLVGAKCMRHPEEIPPWETPVRLIVRNDHGAPVEVYVSGNGASQRLGLVNPGFTARFEVPHGFIGAGAVEFEARASAGRATSGPLNLQPGHTVEFVVTQQFFNSTATILQ